MRILILAALMTLVGCGTVPVAPLVPSPVEPTHTDVTKQIAAVLFVPCPKLPVSTSAGGSNIPAPASTSDSGALMQMYSNLQVQYSNCAIKDDCLIAAVKGAQCKQPKAALSNKPL